MRTLNEELESGVKAHLAGNLSEAESAYKHVLERDISNAVAYNNLGFVYGQQGRWSEAEKHLQTALKLKPDMAMAHVNLGQVLLATGNQADALKHLETAVELDPGNVEAWDNLARFMMRNDEYQKAEYAWTRASRLLPNDPGLLARLGTAIAAQRRLDEALSVYQQALARNPMFGDAWTQIGITHFLLENYGAARNSLLHAISINSKDANALRHLGLIALSRQQAEEAISAFKQVLAISPEDDNTRMDLAVVLLSQEQGVSALEHIDILLSKIQDDERVLFYRALALRQLNQIDEGNAILARVVERGATYARRAIEILSS